MRIIYFILVLLVISCSSNEKNIVGTWKFHSVNLEWDGDESTLKDLTAMSLLKGREVLNAMLKNLKFTFKDNGQYLVHLGKKDNSGKYQISNDSLWLIPKERDKRDNAALFKIDNDTLILFGIEGIPAAIKMIPIDEN